MQNKYLVLLKHPQPRDAQNMNSLFRIIPLYIVDYKILALFLVLCTSTSLHHSISAGALISKPVFPL